ncbi:MAG: ribonuclease R [Lautropia sp.]|nr:ribonuclease R [Lautropia sp.]
MTKNFSDPPSRQAILDTLAAEGAPLSIDELVLRMKVQPEAMVGMRRRVAAMQRDGQILQGRKGDLMLVSRIDLVPGKVSGHRDGFGFFLPDAGGDDIFLPPREMRKVMHGDRVLVRRVGTDSRGRPEGKIVEVTERNKRPVVGRLVEEAGVLMLVPEDQRIKHDVLIEPGGTLGAQPGEVVSVEIFSPPDWNTPAIGRVREVLGTMGDPGMEIEIAVRKFEVPHQFAADVLAEADTLPDALRPADYRMRVDLRDVPLVTIDGEDARDFDDAVYCAPLKNEVGKPVPGWRLLVAIADVSHYLRPGSALDREAQQRTTSVYFPRRVIPMLPEKLSNGLCSINPEVDRLVLVADMVVHPDGDVAAYQFYPAVMHSAARLTYNEVWGILSGDDLAAIERRAPLLEQLSDLYALYKALLQARQSRGAIEFETAETKMLCDDQGKITEIVAQVRNDAHRLIEECMLAANTCAADFLGRNHHPALYRVHEGPSADRLAKLREFLTGTGLVLGDAAAEAREKRGPRPQDYQLLSQQISGRADAALLQTMMLRSMQQAVYTPDNQGHFGLAYEAYAHFTSPIRRYPDLLNHRAIKALLDERRYLPVIEAQENPPQAEEAAGTGTAPAARPAARTRSRKKVAEAEAQAAWESLGQICSANERRADEATRDVQAWLKCVYMRDRVGEVYQGHITGVAPFGVFVTLDDLYVEGMVHVSELGNEYFRFDDGGHMLMGERTGRRYALTDTVQVQVTAVNLEARRIDFRLVEDGAAARGGRHGGQAAGRLQTASAGRKGRDARADRGHGGKRAAGRREADREARGAGDQAREPAAAPVAVPAYAPQAPDVGATPPASTVAAVPAPAAGKRRAAPAVPALLGGQRGGAPAHAAEAARGTDVRAARSAGKPGKTKAPAAGATQATTEKRSSGARKRRK